MGGATPEPRLLQARRAYHRRLLWLFARPHRGDRSGHTRIEKIVSVTADGRANVTRQFSVLSHDRIEESLHSAFDVPFRHPVFHT